MYSSQVDLDLDLFFLDKKHLWMKSLKYRRSEVINR